MLATSYPVHPHNPINTSSIGLLPVFLSPSMTMPCPLSDSPTNRTRSIHRAFATVIALSLPLSSDPRLSIDDCFSLLSFAKPRKSPLAVFLRNQIVQPLFLYSTRLPEELEPEHGLVAFLLDDPQLGNKVSPRPRLANRPVMRRHRRGGPKKCDPIPRASSHAGSAR